MSGVTMSTTDNKQQRRFMFLYLNTGNGHIAQARVLKKAMEEIAPDVPVELVNGFDNKNHLGHFFFEKCYAFACNYLHGAFPLIYDLAQHRILLDFFNVFLQTGTTNAIKRAIKVYHITDIVSFHFALTPPARRAIRELNMDINMTVLCTDPFTGPNAWFYNRREDYLVGSEEMRQTAINENKVAPSHVKVVPFLVDQKFRVPVTVDEKKALRRQYGFDENKRIVLLAGGGEGLPGTLKIINQCILHKANFTIVVVCGRNKPMQQSLELLQKTELFIDLHVFGFVTFMDSLIKMSDLVVSKAGTSTVLEIISSHKPVIISNYIHNQELGNMRFAVYNNVGYFIRHSADIYRKIETIFSSDENYKKASDQFRGLDMDTDATKIARYVLEK